MVALIIAQLTVPLGALAWLAGARFVGCRGATAAAAAVAFLIMGTLLVGIWVYPPLWLALGGLGSLWLLAARRACGRASGRTADLTQAAATLSCTAIALVLLWHGLGGRLAPAVPAIDLTPPLRGRGICVISGGNSALLNFHMRLLPGDAPGRTDRHGVDFIALSSTGLRTRDALWWHPRPPEPADYRIFGAPVFAPCTGLVVDGTDGHPDGEVGNPDSADPPGNHLVLLCDGHSILLAHLRRGSLRVREGARVEAGAQVASVGNSGNSEEPHLHLSAARLEDGEPPTAPRAVPITFGGRFLSRHSCL